MSIAPLRSSELGHIRVERVEKLSAGDVADLSSATIDAIKEGIGFNWLLPPDQQMLEAYWRGVTVVPERVLFIGRLDGTVVASIQLVCPSASRQSMAFAATLTNHFVAPWARGHGLAKALLQAAEAEAKARNYSTLNLAVRATQSAALSLYEECGYQCWGVQPAYEQVGDAIVAGHHFSKQLQPQRVK